MSTRGPKPLQPEIRAALRGRGMTTKQLGTLLGATTDVIREALQRMPDAYIADWTTKRHAIWRVVKPPKNAPPPPLKGLKQ